jgi:hypothetical protein
LLEFSKRNEAKSYSRIEEKIKQNQKNLYPKQKKKERNKNNNFTTLIQKKKRALTNATTMKLKGKDQKFALVAQSCGLHVSLVPYLQEWCADFEWQLDYPYFPPFHSPPFSFIPGLIIDSLITKI